MTKIVNCTPHDVSVHVNGEVRSFPKSGTPARVSVKMERVQTLEGIPVSRSVPGRVENLPGNVLGTFLIVSRMVAATAPDRPDLIIPSGLVRDDSGAVVGCEGFEIG